jgi:hypothetical protein
MQFYSAIKKKKIFSFAGKWMELENIMLMKLAGSESQRSHVVSHMWNIGPKQYYEKLREVINRNGRVKEGS